MHESSTYRIIYLVNRHLEEALTDVERDELNDWLAESEKNRLFFEQLTNEEILHSRLQHMSLVEKEEGKRQILQKIRSEGKVVPMRPVMSKWLRYSAAAIVLVIFSAGAYFYFNHQAPKQLAGVNTPAVASKTTENGALTDNDKAVLTLGDGSKITLGTVQNGAIAEQGNTKIAKINAGELAYNTNTLSEKPQEVLYNTLAIPRGAQYKVTLPDGTQVWLNAKSSLSYPTSFAGKERNVELTGEAYFEVAKNAAMPFKVKVPASLAGGKDVQVEVLGTHFNVMAYNDEPAIKTTLLEGKVLMSKGDAKALLNPGQQAKVSIGETGNKISVKDHADAEEAVGWKKGFITVNNASIQEAMRQISRWYDVDVVYEGKIAERHNIDGALFQRSDGLAVALERVGGRKVHFKIEGKKVTVML